MGSVVLVSGEQVAAAATMGVLGLAVLGVGVAARRERLQLVLGGWTRDSASSASWAAAHVTIGTSLAVAGAVALASAGAVLIAPATWAGPLVVAGSVVLLAAVVVGVVRGTGRLEGPSTTDV